jgi:hypothetical protein
MSINPGWHDFDDDLEEYEMSTRIDVAKLSGQWDREHVQTSRLICTQCGRPRGMGETPGCDGCAITGPPERKAPSGLLRAFWRALRR